MENKATPPYPLAEPGCILVTGGTGLVGQAIRTVLERYPEEGGGHTYVFLSSADADLRDPAATERLLAAHAPVHAIIHLAANVGGLFKNMEQPVGMFEDNLRINTNVLAAAHAQGIQHVLCALSTCIFPDAPPRGYPITAEDLHLGPPHPSNAPYAYAKRMLDVQCAAYQSQYGRRYFCFVPTNIYGPHDNFSLRDGHVIPALVHRAYLAMASGVGTPFVVAGDGTPLRQFIYSEDLARLVLWALFHYQGVARPLLMVPPNSEVPLSKVVEGIASSSGIHCSLIRYDPSRPNGQHKKTADTSQLASLPHPLRDAGFTPLTEGLARTAAWFRKHMAAGTARI